jgi:NAD(P)H-dependent FMN reductase
MDRRMDVKAIILMGSPRKDGNTETLADSLKTGFPVYDIIILSILLSLFYQHV